MLRIGGFVCAVFLTGVPGLAGAQGSCTNLTPGDYTCQITRPEGSRTYLVHVPTSVTGTESVALVIDMHGFTSTASAQRSISGWLEKSDQEGFIASWPQGLDNAWNAQGLCCGSGTQDDVAFIEAVVAAISTAANIDPGQVFATGLSNGGSQTHTMACESADVFAGAAPVSYQLSGGSSFSEIVANCNPANGIPVVHFHGTDDGTVSYENGVLDSLGSEDSLAAWAEIQSCQANTTTEQISSNTVCETHQNCDDGAAVSLCTVTGGTHVLYGDLGTATIADHAWAFFQSFQGGEPPPPPPPGEEQTLFADDFSQGLGQWIETGEGDWNTESLHSSSGYPAGASGSPAAHSDNCDTGCRLTQAQAVDLTGFSAASLEFLRFVDFRLDSGEFLQVEVFDGAAWVEVFLFTHGAGDDNTWHAESLDLAPYLGVADFRVRFTTLQSNTLEHVHVDDVIVTATPE